MSIVRLIHRFAIQTHRNEPKSRKFKTSIIYLIKSTYKKFDIQINDTQIVKVHIYTVEIHFLEF
jgi:hypothetical protein